MAAQLYALLVGVDRYDNPAQAPHLRGCVADVEGTFRWLTQQLNVPETNVLLLTSRMEQGEAADRRATRANIIRGWQTHLSQAGPGDQVFFNYSGHGARARSVAPQNVSGYDETLVPCDSRTPNVYDILDKELAQLIQSVEKNGAQVTVFLDCCHSGSGTRAVQDVADDEPMVRRCSADERERPLDTVVAGAVQAASTRSTTAPSGWVPLGNHVLLAGCRDEELSHEYRSPDTGQWQGATTYFFHKAMANLHPNMTWSDVHDFVQTHVHKVYPAQSPQLEGPGDMQVFGVIGQRQQPHYLVTEVDGEHFAKLNVGVTSGLTVGSTVALYPPGSDLTGAAIATAVVDEVKVDHVWVKLDTPTRLELASRVKITGHAYEDQTLTVAVATEELRRELETVDSGFIRIVSAQDTSSVIQYRLLTQNGSFVITDASGVQVVQETPSATPAGTNRLVKLLEHLAIYNNVATLRNPLSTSRMAGVVTIANPITYTQYSRRGPVDPTPLRTSATGNEATIESGEAVYFMIKNHSDSPVYLAVLEFTPEFAINRIYPPRARYTQVKPRAEIPIDFPSLTLDDPNLAKGRYLYKVLATAEPTEFEALLLPPLNKIDGASRTRAVGGSTLAQLMNAIRHDGTRAATLRVDETDDQWTTAQLEITVTASGRSVELVAGEQAVDLETTGRSITIGKPAAMSGSLSVGPAAPSNRSTQKTVQPPPGMDNPDASRYFQLVTLGTNTRAAGEAPMLLTVESEADQLAAVTPESPLRVQMPVEDDPSLRGILAIAFDGENYYVAGASRDAGNHLPSTTRSAEKQVRTLTINIDFLPPDGASSKADPDEPVDTRDLKRTARLFFYKVFLKDLPEDTGVRLAGLDSEGKAVYAQVTSASLVNRRKVALMIHGITADTTWLVERVWPLITNSEAYDLCLAYDYESFATGIKENARLLHEALEGLGFGKDNNLELDIYAHSMGTLVARALVEIWGGERYVNRVFMGGPPNAGSPLAKLRSFVPWLGTVMINQLGAIPASMLLSWSLKTLVSSGVGLVDLDPDGDFLEEINGSEKTPTSVPYYIQTGNNSRAYDKWNRIFRYGMKIADSALDEFFEGEHDLAVGVKSASILQEANWPHAKVAIIGTNHFGYFYTGEGRPVLEGWLKEARRE